MRKPVFRVSDLVRHKPGYTTIYQVFGELYMVWSAGVYKSEQHHNKQCICSACTSIDLGPSGHPVSLHCPHGESLGP